MRAARSLLLALALSAALSAAQSRTAKSLDIYLVDVEGGNATLFVSPSGESVLIDSGNGGAAAARDAGRIIAAAKDAGLTQIDHLITTHWHGDHFGGMAELASRIPIRNFIDHGPNVQPAAAADEFLQKTYPSLYSKSKHTVAKPGDKIPIAGLDWHIVAAAGQPIKTSLPGAGKPNPYCAAFKPMDADPSENAQSVGSIVTFGKFRVAHLGDLTWNKEFDLMCPDQSHWHRRSVRGVASWAADLEFGRARARDCPSGGDHEQRDSQGRAARCDEDYPFGAGPRGPLAASLLAPQRAGVHGPGALHRQRGRRAVGRDADRCDPGTATRTRRASAARAQWRGVLDQGFRADGWIVHRDERT